MSYIALNVLFMTHKAATWIISRKAYLRLLTHIYNAPMTPPYNYIPHFHQAHYDAVQQRKKNTSRQASLRSGNLAMTVEEEDEKEEKEEKEVKRRHFTMPESVV